MSETAPEILNALAPKKNKLWVATVHRFINAVEIFPTSICYDLDDDIDDIIEKMHKKMHIEFKDIDASRLFLHYANKEKDTLIKRDVLVVDALNKAEELGIKNSLEIPFFILKQKSI